MLITVFVGYQSPGAAAKAVTEIPNLPIHHKILRQIEGCNPNHKPEVVEIHLSHSGNTKPHPSHFPQRDILEAIATHTNAVRFFWDEWQVWPRLQKET